VEYGRNKEDDVLVSRNAKGSTKDVVSAKESLSGSKDSEQGFPLNSQRSSEDNPIDVPLHTQEKNMKSLVKKPTKCIREKRGQVKMVVGEDLAVSDIANFHGKLLVGRFTGKSPGHQAMQSWLEQTWSPFLGYTPEAHILAKGWNSFLCKSKADSEKLLRRSWSWGSSGLVLKPWTVEFDPEHEPVSQMKVWAILPGLPLGLLDQRGIGSNWRQNRDFHGIRTQLGLKKRQALGLDSSGG
jgi:hypothetical protein